MNEDSVPVPFVRSPYNYDREQASLASGLACLDESLAIQSAAEEADINTIVRRFGLTGELPDDVKMPVSGDFTGVGDFHSAMNLVRTAQEEFLRFPADLRARFGNDPGLLMAFLDNPDNRDEAIKLGIVKAPTPEPHPMAVRIVGEPVKDPGAPSGK